MKDMLSLIRTRRSIREYTDKMPADDIIRSIIEAGRWAPSGLNNQPWRLVIIKDKAAIDRMACFTKYSKVIKSAPVLLVVFMDRDKSYHRDKDLQSIGACIENILLAIHSLGLGSCWLGEILNRKDEVAEYLALPKSYELMAVISLGYPKLKDETSSRIPLSELIHKEI